MPVEQAALHAGLGADLLFREPREAFAGQDLARGPHELVAGQLPVPQWYDLALGHAAILYRVETTRSHARPQAAVGRIAERGAACQPACPKAMSP